MIRRTLTLALAALLVCSLVAGVAPVTADDGDGATCEPENSLTYDEFRSDDATISSFSDDGNATVEKANTQVGVDADDMFVRLSVQNANTYCVEYTVQMSSDVVTPSTLGTISADETAVSADWRSTHDFDTDETYTEVTMTVPGGTEATFAPSQLRIKSLQWTSTIESSGFIDDMRERLGLSGPPLEERTHTLTGNTSEQVTIPLTHPDDAEESIDNWQATYTVGDSDQASILSKDSGNAVFYRTVDDGAAIELVYNEPAEVTFTAEPTLRERASFNLQSFVSSITEVFDIPAEPFGGVFG